MVFLSGEVYRQLFIDNLIKYYRQYYKIKKTPSYFREKEQHLMWNKTMEAHYGKNTTDENQLQEIKLAALKERYINKQLYSGTIKTLRLNTIKNVRVENHIVFLQIDTGEWLNRTKLRYNRTSL
jgi:hypothetical protein